MSTSAIIIVPGIKACLYKHWDGYPKAVLPWLEQFNRTFTQKRGKDPAYKLAQLIRSSVTMGEEFHLDPCRYTGWGVFDAPREEEYIYLLNNDGTVTCEAAAGDWRSPAEIETENSNGNKSNLRSSH